MIYLNSYKYDIIILGDNMNMLNAVRLVGRLKNDIKIEKTKDDEEFIIMVLSVPREKPEKDGSYKSDLVDVKVLGDIIYEITKKCKKEDLIGVKAHVATKVPNKEHSKIEIIADSISYLAGNGQA